MATTDMVWIAFRNDADGMTVASEALPAHVESSVWQTWPWQKTKIPAGEVFRGWFVGRDSENRLLFLTGGSDYFLFDAQDVQILDYGPDADLSLASDIKKADKLMTVKELINLLGLMNQDSPVSVSNIDSTAPCRIVGVVENKDETGIAEMDEPDVPFVILVVMSVI